VHEGSAGILIFLSKFDFKTKLIAEVAAEQLHAGLTPMRI
jgi:hypothetical protein